jgi:hypothetical protein
VCGENYVDESSLIEGLFSFKEDYTFPNIDHPYIEMDVEDNFSNTGTVYRTRRMARHGNNEGKVDTL